MKTWKKIAAALTLSAASSLTASTLEAGGGCSGGQASWQVAYPQVAYPQAACQVPQPTVVVVPTWSYRTAEYVHVPTAPVINAPLCPPSCPTTPAAPVQPTVVQEVTTVSAPAAPVMPAVVTVNLPPNNVQVAEPVVEQTCRVYTVLYRTCSRSQWVVYGTCRHAQEALLTMNRIEELGYQTMVK